ncbi:hypothetical protein HanPI659440_Chr10g0375581 [Helianthus annuus]|nr:hypothetical protein HanPI659440_Chr10g0375581 [Helianthus annuus]
MSLGAPYDAKTSCPTPEFENHSSMAVQQAEQASVHFLLPATVLRTVSTSLRTVSPWPCGL